MVILTRVKSSVKRWCAGQISGPSPHGQNSHADRSGGFGRAGLDQKSALHTSVFKDNLALVMSTFRSTQK